MSDVKKYMRDFLLLKQLLEPEKHHFLFERFAEDEENIKAVTEILNSQKMLMEKWKLKNRVDDIIRQHVAIPNGNVGKPYEAIIDFEALGWTDIAAFALEGLEALGLVFDKDTRAIKGTPTQSGDTKLQFRFRVQGEADEAPWNVKNMPIFINADPKTLWKTLTAPADAPFQKEPEARGQATLGDKTLVVASKRGRSHANVGTFRDDDFAYSYFDTSDWSIVAVADGAGSAKFSREGSRLACQTVINYFEEILLPEKNSQLNDLIQAHRKQPTDELKKSLNLEVYQLASGAAYAAHQAINKASVDTGGVSLKDFHTTLVFALFKKFDFGYAVLSFSVGDCPLAILNKELTEVTLLNKLDVGEFSGGTRFLTMPEIFAVDSLVERCRYKEIEDFSYLILMSDGIYDPKFGVEANLEKIESWKNLLRDLAGENEDGAKVELNATNPESGEQLLAWMDFWSPGNHDDRTLALVF